MNPNGIKKNDMILVTRDNGKEYVGKATKVGPWVKNPMITTVRYHFIDEAGVAWSARTDAVKCRMAPASMIPKEPEPAAIHPIMARWSLGKTKRGPMMKEGYYFAVPVLLNGKKVGEVIDDGNGWSVMTRFKDHLLATAFEKDCTEWCKVNGARLDYLEAESEFWAWWDEGRPKGISALDFNKSEREHMLKFMAGIS